MTKGNRIGDDGRAFWGSIPLLQQPTSRPVEKRMIGSGSHLRDEEYEKGGPFSWQGSTLRAGKHLGGNKAVRA